MKVQDFQWDSGEFSKVTFHLFYCLLTCYFISTFYSLAWPLNYLVRLAFIINLLDQKVIRVLDIFRVAVWVMSLTVRFLLFACTVKRGSEVGSVSNTAMGPPPASTYC